MRRQPTVTVHVASIDTAAATELCIRSMRRFAGYPFRLTVGDCGSTDGSLAMLRALAEGGWLQLEISEGGRMHAQWLDDWLGRCESEYAVFVDSDIEFRRGRWLTDLVSAARRARAAIVCAETCPEQAFFVEPVGGRTVRLAQRPAPWLMLVDVRALAPLGVSFAFQWEASEHVPEGTIAHDVAAALARAATDAGLRCVEMPRRYRTKYIHYQGLSWDAFARRFDLAPGAGPKEPARRQRDLSMIRRRLDGLRAKSLM